jgi:hypothetical protein
MAQYCLGTGANREEQRKTSGVLNIEGALFYRIQAVAGREFRVPGNHGTRGLAGTRMFVRQSRWPQ